jgi:hypothetical protein
MSEAGGPDGKSALRNSLQACIHEENAFSACKNTPYIVVDGQAENQCALDRVGASNGKPGHALAGRGGIA